MALSKTTETQDNLEVSTANQLSKTVVVLSGGDVSRGDLVSQTGMFTAGTAVAGSNTGDGTVSGETASDFAQVGTYTLVCTAEAGDAGTFSVQAPNGVFLPDLTVAVAYSNQIGLTIADGAEDFDTGDSFTVLVIAGAGKVIPFVTGAIPYTVMQEDVDATSGDVSGLAFRQAELKATEVDFGTGTDAEVREELDAKGIFLRD